MSGPMEEVIRRAQAEGVAVTTSWDVDEQLAFVRSRIAAAVTTKELQAVEFGHHLVDDLGQVTPAQLSQGPLGEVLLFVAAWLGGLGYQGADSQDLCNVLSSAACALLADRDGAA